jgi:hypothetical protein
VVVRHDVMSEKTRLDSRNRRVKANQATTKDASSAHTGFFFAVQAAEVKMDNLRLGAGLGAAGLASGLASSHFDGSFCWSVRLKRVEVLVVR